MLPFFKLNKSVHPGVVPFRCGEKSPVCGVKKKNTAPKRQVDTAVQIAVGVHQTRTQ